MNDCDTILLNITAESIYLGNIKEEALGLIEFEKSITEKAKYTNFIKVICYLKIFLIIFHIVNFVALVYLFFTIGFSNIVIPITVFIYVSYTLFFQYSTKRFKVLERFKSRVKLHKSTPIVECYKTLFETTQDLIIIKFKDQYQFQKQVDAIDFNKKKKISPEMFYLIHMGLVMLIVELVLSAGWINSLFKPLIMIMYGLNILLVLSWVIFMNIVFVVNKGFKKDLLKVLTAIFPEGFSDLVKYI